LVVLSPVRVGRIAFAAWLFVGAAVTAWAAQGIYGALPGPSVWAYAALSLACLALSAVFSASETAFLSVNGPKLREMARQGHRVARALVPLHDRLERTQASLLVGNNLVNTAATAFALMLWNATPLGPAWREVVNTAVMTPLVLVLGEIVPKSLARAYPDGFLLRSGRLCAPVEWALRPVGQVVLWVSVLLMRLTGQEGEPQVITREDLRVLARMGETEGLLREEQRRMIHAVLDLDEQRVEQAMRPLSDIVSVEEGIALTEFLSAVEDHGYSRIPVYRERIDNIVGVVNVLDVIYAADAPETIDPFIRRELLFVPESKRVATLLTELRFRRSPMAFVVDEYGGIVGLVTIEDLVEEIVGEIRDERDEADDTYRVNARTMTLECDGKTEIDALNERLDRMGAQIPEGDYETIAGFVVRALDKIPRVNDVVETDSLLVLVLAADDRSVQRVKIIRKRGGERRRRGARNAVP
jgi:putative hemolysin